MLKAKLIKIGTSKGVIIPSKLVKHYNIGQEITLNIIMPEAAKKENIIIKEPQKDENIIMPAAKKENIIMPENPKREKFNAEWCNKHSVFKGSCGCK